MQATHAEVDRVCVCAIKDTTIVDVVVQEIAQRKKRNCMQK